MNTYSLLSITSYVGSSDTDTTMKAYRYDFAYNADTAFFPCTDPISQVTRYCAGEHTLKQITSTVYQNGTAHALKPALFHNTTKYNTYSDHTQTVTGGVPMWSKRSGSTWMTTWTPRRALGVTLCT
jgi:hypothetical protein